MKETSQKLGITIEDGEITSTLAGSPIIGCPEGYAVYTFVGTRSMQRIGSATCLFPSVGYSSATGSSFVTISSALSTQFSNITNGTGIKELRFAICCPTAATVGGSAVGGSAIPATSTESKDAEMAIG